LPKADSVFNEQAATVPATSNVFTGKMACVNINEFSLYHTHFNYIPNTIEELKIDLKKAHNWFLGVFEKEIKDCYFIKKYFNGIKTALYRDILYFIDDDLLVQFNIQESRVRFLFRKTDILKVEALAKRIQRFKKRKWAKPELKILTQLGEGIEAEKHEIVRQKASIPDNYNDDFKDVNEIILKRLRQKNDKGIVLLHGKLGTGKTSYIRHLIASVKKDFIFLPPSMAGSITGPALMRVLTENPNTIFVIEDAENIVIDRNKEGYSPVSAILNISDGLLSDCLNIQIICSFNTDLSKVDSALLRKGRLIAKYEFKELTTDKARKLSEKLGFSSEINEPMTLTDIYNQDERAFKQDKSSVAIGFKPMISENTLQTQAQ
ncbi:MAG: AAA family ATPase, partial [Ekhidna sp.]|nr:AAA family ATPase [Ekhidna sp.]